MLHVMIFGALLAIDPAKSSASFSVSHIFVDRVTGTVPVTGGTIDVADGGTVPTRVDATLDPTRFKTDEPDRDAALQGLDWFDTKRFPTWTFASTKIVATAKGFTMDGSLTIHGVTQPEELDVIVAGTAEHPVYHATGHIDRQAFGMQKTRLDPVIGNIVDVDLNIAVK
jgi:polyisoprenoid-binding protein YceI